MKHYILVIIAVFFAYINMDAQNNEYRYLAIRLGFSNAFSGQPGTNPEKFIYGAGAEGTALPQMHVSPAASFMGYVPGVKASILYHIDFTGDVAGMFTGIDYNFTGISSKYETATRGLNIVEIHRIHMVGVPLAFKYGPDIWDTQRYVYLGGQFNYIASMYTNEKASWGENKGRKLEADEYQKTTFSIFAGVNWKILNLQFDYYPKSVFNTGYKLVSEKTGESSQPNLGQVGSFYKITLGVSIPYGWLSEQSFKIRRFLLKWPWK